MSISLVESMPHNNEKLAMDNDFQASGHERHMSTPSQHCGESPMVCLYSNCDAEPFDTDIALNQHYVRTHLSQRRHRSKGKFFCDYDDCDRRSSPFERLDGLRSHLRAAHKESIPKKGDWSKSALIAGHVDDHLQWWRCPKCLRRIESKHELGDCPSCKLPKQERCKPHDPPALAGIVDTESEPSNIQDTGKENIRTSRLSHFRNIVPKQHVHDDAFGRSKENVRMERSDAFSSRLSV